MENVTSLKSNTDYLQLEKESKVLFEAVVMQELLDLFEDFNSKNEELSSTLHLALVALTKAHPDTAINALNTFATITNLLRVSAQYGDFACEKSNEYHEIQNNIERLEQIKFASRKQVHVN
ncbi:MAG: hypothetical protein JWQ25_1962 [Daejeonella sp.]|nr:hypothetical protein [Daejeonella sp.]